MAEALVATLQHPVLVLDAELRVVAASPRFYETFGTTEGDTLGVSIFELGDRQWDNFALRRLLSEILPEASRIDDFELRYSLPNVGPRRMQIQARRLVQEEKKRRSFSSRSRT
jgi:two-component system CheB/CheR fusion protein